MTGTSTAKQALVRAGAGERFRKQGKFVTKKNSRMGVLIPIRHCTFGHYES